MAKQVHDAAGANQHIAPGVTDQVPPQPGMWMGGPSPSVSTTGAVPENWNMGTPPSAAGEQVDPTDIVVPYGPGGNERLGARYCIDTMVRYNEPANWQPTRASEFYGWTTGK